MKTLHTRNNIHRIRSRRVALAVGGFALLLGWATAVRADPIDWTGAQEINAAGGNKVLSDDITLSGDAEINLFFGLEYLVVAGGGGGGGIGTVSGGSGGGGAGGLLKYVEGEADNSGDELFVITPQSYAVSVGAGGKGGTGVARGENGENSSFADIESLGGGGGGGANLSGSSGGSGGGGGTQGTVSYSGGAGTAGQGHKGGAAAGSSSTRSRRGGGGGGAGGDGIDGVEGGMAGDGGSGLATSITGTEVRLAGGGGGGAGTNNLAYAGSGMDGGGDGTFDGTGGSGDANTGGGGGGTARWGGGPYSGGDGGSGIVVVRYEGAEAAAGGTITYITEHAYGIAPGAYDAGVHGAIQYTVHSFTATGSHSFVATDLDLDRRLGATLSGSIGGNHGLTHHGPGVLTLSGNNTYTGGTTVAAGVLRVDNTAGSGTGSGAVLIAAGAGLGGSGTISGDVTFAEGAKFLFDPSATLTIDGAIVFEGAGEDAFGVADLLVADWSQVPNNTYILIEGVVDMNSLANVGADNAYDLEDGRQAYFLPGSLALEVIPEPGTLGLLMIAVAGIWARRRSIHR